MNGALVTVYHVTRHPHDLPGLTSQSTHFGGDLFRLSLDWCKLNYQRHITAQQSSITPERGGLTVK